MKRHLPVVLFSSNILAIFCFDIMPASQNNLGSVTSSLFSGRVFKLWSGLISRWDVL